MTIAIFSTARPWLTSCLALSLSSAIAAHELETVEVSDQRINLLGQSISASEGVVGQQEIAVRPILRTGEVLELVPGLVVTQHSGTGKANQYFLRGFNLDHGTDFASVVDGMPVNRRSHGHGQGYTDLNFLIPETVESLRYRKGGYFADVGDFSGAGSAQIRTLNSLNSGKLVFTLGEDNYYRLLLMNSSTWSEGESLYALELNRYDGPWTDIEEDLDKINLLAKHSMPFAEGQLSLSLMAYDNSWNSADQIPARAVEQGLIDELGSIDPTVGGQSSRYSFSASWTRDQLSISAYAIDYQMNLWSNFSYFLEDEVNGDQFEQVDKRQIFGGELRYQFEDQFRGKPMHNTLGFQLQADLIDEVGLYHTKARQRLGVTRSDAIDEVSSSVFWENRISWSHHLRTVFGARYDHFSFDVAPRVNLNTAGVDLSSNGGNTSDNIASLKGSVIYTINQQWEGYFSAGQGFHSNDARGTTINIDPSSGNPVDTVDPLVRSNGYELGLRGYPGEKLNISASLWQLDLDSELLFVGDAGNTEASRASSRYGAEIAAYYYFNERWSLDLEYAYTDAEFSNSAPEGDLIPGAIEQVVQAGLTTQFENGWFGSLRLRHFGERPLVEDGSVKSDASTVWNLRAGYRQSDWAVHLDVLNLTDNNAHDIDYFYESRLAGEASGTGTEDIHYHVIEPRTLRLSLSLTL